MNINITNMNGGNITENHFGENSTVNIQEVRSIISKSTELESCERQELLDATECLGSHDQSHFKSTLAKFANKAPKLLSALGGVANIARFIAEINK